MELIKNKITDRKNRSLLFGICWLVYFSTYLGRLNYSAVLAQMVADQFLTKEQGGLIGTGFFMAYGIGQIFSGILGDKLSPKWLVFGGLSLSAGMNFCMYQIKNPTLMLVIWTINGLVQAFIWSPLLRFLCDYLVEEIKPKYCMLLNSTVPLGTMTAYGLAAAIIAVFHWKKAFLFGGIILLTVGISWFVISSYLERYAQKHGEAEYLTNTKTEHTANRQDREVRNRSFLWLMESSGLFLILFALVVQGALKDGVTTWIPTYMNEEYQLGSVASLIGTMIIPLFNLLGVFLAGIINRKWVKNEMSTSGIFYCFCLGALTLLWLTSGNSIVLAFVMLGISTTAMMAVNTMFIAVLPAYFGIYGKASTISGVLNSAVYIGSAVSTFGIGALSSLFGWKVTILIWMILAFIAGISCFSAKEKWKHFCRTERR